MRRPQYLTPNWRDDDGSWRVFVGLVSKDGHPEVIMKDQTFTHWRDARTYLRESITNLGWNPAWHFQLGQLRRRVERLEAEEEFGGSVLGQSFILTSTPGPLVPLRLLG